MVVGKLTYLEVRNREIFEQSLPDKKMTAEKREAVAAILKRPSDR
jgi:hypothetical protein